MSHRKIRVRGRDGGRHDLIKKFFFCSKIDEIN